MLISDNKRFVFVHIAKTAGTSIRGCLEPYAMARPGKLYSLLRQFDLPRDYRRYRFRRHDSLSIAERKMPARLYHSYTKFAFVRNPWDRLVSGYFGYYTFSKGERHKKTMTFSEFIEWQQGRDNQQYLRIINSSGNLDLDFMGRYENIHQDCKELGLLLGIDISLPHENKSARSKKDYREYYDDTSYKFVCENWAKDIELLGYKFD